jgi:hypothetical protein
MRTACGANTCVYDQKVWAFIVDEHHQLANMLATNSALRLTCFLGLSRSKGIYFRRGYEAKTPALFSSARCTVTDNRRFTNTPRMMQLLQVKMNDHLLEGGRLSDCADEFLRMVEEEAVFNSIYEDLAQMKETHFA